MQNQIDDHPVSQISSRRFMAANKLGSLRFWLLAAASLHLVLWFLLPSLLMKNISLDMAEGLAWGKEWRLGYEKDPPLWPWISEFMAVVSFKNVWSQYLASQLCIATVFFSVWRLGRRVTTIENAALGVLLLEGIFYFNYVTPEFNDIVTQMPFAALFGWLFHRCLVENRHVDWILCGVVIGLGTLSRYSMGAYIIPLLLFTVLHPVTCRRILTAGPWLMAATAFLVFLPHLYWMFTTNFVSIEYVGRRAPVATNALKFATQVLSFITVQIAVAIPMIGMAIALFLWRRRGAPVETAPGNFDRVFLIVLALGPAVFSVVLSIVTLRPPRHMWGAPLFCFLGLLTAVLIKPEFTPQRWKKFAFGWLAALCFPMLMFILDQQFHTALTGSDNRAHYPGQLLANQVTQRWHALTGKRLDFVVGDTWHAGNVAFYSIDRPSVYFNQYLHNPWAPLEDIHVAGGVIVWEISGTDAAMPKDIAAQFPEAVLQPEIVLQGRTSSYKVGVAVVRPTIGNLGLKDRKKVL
jgi:4-amino-4-deoxy-L-arabinose transferase-like glycosyltransferase